MLIVHPKRTYQLYKKTHFFNHFSTLKKNTRLKIKERVNLYIQKNKGYNEKNI